MRCLDRFNMKMNYSGGSLRNENIFNSRKLLEETFSDDASFTFGVYFWELGSNSYDNKEQIGIRLYNRKFSQANGVMVSFQTLYHTPVVVGDIVYDSNVDEYLICTESFDIDGVNYKGKFTLCNWMLKWQNKEGKVLEYPCCDMNTTQYNSGEQSNKQFTIGSSQHMLTLPCDENTVILNNPQRFYLDKNTINPTTFIVTQNDTTSYNYGKKGLVKVTVMEYPSNHETDRIDLGICDYVDFLNNNILEDNANIRITENNSDVKISKSVILYDTCSIKSGGDKQVFIGKFYDDFKNEILSVIPKWNVICDFVDELEIDETNNQIAISIDNDDYVDEEFKIVFSDKDEKYSSSLIISVDSLL